MIDKKKKHIEDSLRDGLIITIGAAGIFFRLRMAKVKPPKVSLDAMDVTKTYWWDLRRHAGERLCSLQIMDQRVNTTTKILWPSQGK